jgi:hypothetical protein
MTIVMPREEHQFISILTLVPVRPIDAGIDRKALLSEMGDTSTPRRVNAAIPPNCLDAFLTNSPSPM